MGRVRQAPKVGIKVRIPEDLHRQVSLVLLDPRYGKAKWGKWTELMETLLRRWLREQQLSLQTHELESEGEASTSA